MNRIRIILEEFVKKEDYEKILSFIPDSICGIGFLS